MVCFDRFVGRCLACLFGLILISPFSAFAQVAPDGSVTYVGPFDDPIMAQAQCMADYTRVRSQLSTRGSNTCHPGTINGNGGCVWQPVDSLPGRACDVFYVSTFTGGQKRYFYGCRVRAQLISLSDGSATGTQLSFSCTSQPTNDNVYGSGGAFNTTSFHGYYTTNNEGPDCSNKPSFTSRTLRAPTPNGSGNVCYQGCSYSVAVGYVGTYPTGYLEFDFASNNRGCTEGESDPVDEPINPDEPLDLDPEDGGVDKPVDPGQGRDQDGRGTSSGGGTCDAPPACTGEPIQCNILYQTWATRCEAKKLADGLVGGEPGEPGAGDGQVVDAIERLRDDLASGWNDGGVTDGAGLDELSGLLQTKEFSPSDIDTSGWGFPRSCPVWDDVSFPLGNGVFTIQLSSFTAHCTIFEWTGYLIVAFAAFWASMILLRGD